MSLLTVQTKYARVLITNILFFILFTIYAITTLRGAANHPKIQLEYELVNFAMAFRKKQVS